MLNVNNILVNLLALFWIVLLLLFLLEVKLRRDVIIQYLCTNHWHFTIAFHFYLYRCFHGTNQVLKLLFISRDFLLINQNVDQYYLSGFQLSGLESVLISMSVLFFENAGLLIDVGWDYQKRLQSFQLLTPQYLLMSMRKNSILIPIMPAEPESPTEKLNERAFQRWLHKNQFQNETPVLLENSFRNLEKPLEYIKDTKIRKLETQSELMIDDLHNQKESIAEMSKSTYKKVISRDRVDYQFGSSALQDKSWYRTHNQDAHKTQAKKKDDNTKILQKRNQLTKQFIHNQHQYDIEQRTQKKQLTLEVIKQIDSKDFEEKHKDVEFYQVFLRDEYQKHISNFSDISQNYEMDELLNKIRFTLIDRDSYYSPKSAQYLFKAQEQLDFWRRYSNEAQEINNADQIQIMKRCHNFNPKQPSSMQLLDFATGKLDSQILASYYQLKSKQEAQIKINENDQNLEQEYNKKKQEYDFMRSMKMKDKTQKIAIKYNKNTTQTNDELEDQSFDSYFEESVKSLMIRLEDLNKIRDSVMEKKQNETTKKTMLVNIGHEIKSILFRLLIFTLQGENFVNYEELIDTGDQATAQKKILQIIYHEFHKVKNLQVDGIPKTKIIETYLQEREKNQKMFELLGRIYAPEKVKIQPKSKSPAPKPKTKPQKK